MDRRRDVVPDGAVQSDLNVVRTPSIQLFAGVGKACEPVSVQTFGPKLAVERLDEAVVRWLTGLGEVQYNVVGVSPQIEVVGDELGAVIDPDCLRVAVGPADPFQGLNHVFPAIRELRIGDRTVSGMRVDDREDQQLLPCRELVMHEVHCPDFVRPDGFLTVFAQLRLHPPLRVLVAQLEAQLIVYAKCLLHVDDPAFPA